MYIRGSYKEPLKKEVSYPGTEEECNSKMNILMVIFCKVIQALYLFILISKKHVGLTGLYFCKIQYKMSLDQEWVLSIMPKCSVERTNSDTTKKKRYKHSFSICQQLHFIICHFPIPQVDIHIQSQDSPIQEQDRTDMRSFK